MAFVKVVGVVRSTTFVFKVLCTSIQNFGVICVQTDAQQNKNGPAALCAATPRPRSRCLRRAPPDAPPTEAAASLGVCAPMRLVFSRARVAPVVVPYARRAQGGPPVRPARPPYERRPRHRRTTTVSSLSLPCHLRAPI
jgi:hypothetical protein